MEDCNTREKIVCVFIVWKHVCYAFYAVE